MSEARRSVNGDEEWDGSASRAENLTRLLHTSDAALFLGLRDQFQAHGFEPRHLVLADLWPDDPGCEFGILLSVPNRVFTFDYFYGRDGDLWTQYRTGRIGNLKEITATWEGGTYDGSIRDGLARLSS